MAAIRQYHSIASETLCSIDLHHADPDSPEIFLPPQENIPSSQSANVPSLLSVSFAMNADNLSITPLLTCGTDTTASPADVEVAPRSSKFTIPPYQDHLSTRTVSQEQSKFAAYHTQFGVLELALQAAAIPLSVSPQKSFESAVEALESDNMCCDPSRYPNSNQSDDPLINPVEMFAQISTWHNPLPVRGSETLKGIEQDCRSEEQHLATVANTTSTTAINNGELKLTREIGPTHLSAANSRDDVSGIAGWDYAVNIYLRWAIERQYLNQRGILFEWARESLGGHFIDPEDLKLSEFLELFEAGVTLEAWLVSHLAPVIRRVVRRRVLARQKLSDAGLNRLVSEAHLGVFERMTDEEQAAFITTLRLREARVVLAEEGLTLQDHELEDFAEASSNDRIAFIRNRKREEYEREADCHGNSWDEPRNAESGPSGNIELSGQRSQLSGSQHSQSVSETPAAKDAECIAKLSSDESGAARNFDVDDTQSSVDKFTTTQKNSCVTEWTLKAEPGRYSSDTDALCRTVVGGSIFTASILSSDSACSRRAIPHACTTVSSNTASVLSSEEIIPLARVSAIVSQEAQEARVVHEATASVVLIPGKPRRREHIEFNELPTVEKPRSSSTKRTSVSHEIECVKEEAWNAPIDNDKPRGMVRKISQFFGSMRMKIPRKSSVVGITT